MSSSGTPALAAAMAVDDAEDDQIASMSTDDIVRASRLLDNEIRVLKDELQRTNLELESVKEKIKENQEKIKLNKQLPYLVGNIVEILEMNPEDEAEEDGANIDLDSQRKGKCVVLKTSTRQTIFLPVVGLVDPDKLKPGDLVGVNKDSYLILDTLPSEYDSRVKAMEVDEKPTEDYNDIGGLEKQIQELVEAIVLPMTHKDRFQKLGIRPPKGVLLYGPPGTGKTLMARACAAQTNATFLKLAGPQHKLQGMAMDPGSRTDIDFGDVFSTSNPPPTAHMINFSLQQQSQVQFFPSYGLHSHNPPVSSHPSPSGFMLGCTTPSPASTTTTELDNSEDLSETVADDAILAYINQFLLEDEDDESFPVTNAPMEDSALLAVEKPFVDILKSAKPAQVYERRSWMTDQFDIRGTIGLDDVVRSTQKSCHLPCEMVKEDSLYAAHKGRKNPHDDGLETEERKSKQFALCEEETVREMFDKVLLCTDENCVFRSPLPADAQIGSGYVKGSGNRRGRRKGRSVAGPEEEAVDLTTLLIHCAQAAAIDDHRNSNELLKQIRKHSCATGDAGQRLAHYFANGLEARLAGTGSTVYRQITAKRTSTGDILKAFSLYVKACPFKLISHYFANSTILNASKSATRLHIIDFGIQYGFQYPVLMQRFSKRRGGPPNLRITGVDFPQPGFRPAERIEATGRRLHEYARMFNVPFEYHPIAGKWDTIQVEDLNINSNEVLVVNCLYRMRNMMDETVTDDSPRTRVLNTIRKLNPHLFVHGVVNGTYNAPFFVTRFKEAMFFFSSVFDMLEANALRMDEHRLLIEREFYGREALNVIACEGTERVERPETYKQWQMRNLRAGFRPLPLNEEIMKKARYKVSKSYHRDFLVDQDNKWMLQGWKGRVIFALSAWTS